MNAVTFETVVTAGHQLHLPAELPVGCRLRVTVGPIDTVGEDNGGQALLLQSELLPYHSKKGLCKICSSH